MLWLEAFYNGEKESSMDKLKELWKMTKFRHNELEKKIADNYLNFLREVARYYLYHGGSLSQIYWSLKEI
ncbi:MAG: hypothetical protein ABIA66_03935 [Candidatus Omnitrophota bacterium]